MEAFGLLGHEQPNLEDKLFQDVVVRSFNVVNFWLYVGWLVTLAGLKLRPKAALRIWGNRNFFHDIEGVINDSDSSVVYCYSDCFCCWELHGVIPICIYISSKVTHENKWIFMYIIRDAKIILATSCFHLLVLCVGGYLSYTCVYNVYYPNK